MDLKLVDHHDPLVAKVEERERRRSGRNDLTEVAKGDLSSARHATESNSTSPRRQPDNVEKDVSWSITQHGCWPCDDTKNSAAVLLQSTGIVTAMLLALLPILSQVPALRFTTVAMLLYRFLLRSYISRVDGPQNKHGRPLVDMPAHPQTSYDLSRQPREGPHLWGYMAVTCY